jgi:hypothetical protein
MLQQTIRRILVLFVIALITSTIAFAESPAASEAPAITTLGVWPDAQSVGSTKGKLFVVTVDQPQRRQTCRIQSFTLEKIVCSCAIGGPRTYLTKQVAALIIPGDGNSKLRIVLGLNGGIGAAIWGTVALAAACPACAAATGVAALLLFCAAGAILIGDDQPDRLLYLAPGQKLTGKLSPLQP